MKLTCYGAYTNEKEFWLPSKEMNALYVYNTSDQSVKYKGLFVECKNSRAWNIKKIVEYHDELFFFSMCAYQVWKLNRITNEIEEYTYCTHPVGQITNIEIVQNEAWIIPNSFRSPIVFFDLQKKKGHLFQWENKAHLNYGEGSFTRTVRSGDILYFATRNKDDIHLCILDGRKKKISFKDLNTLSLIQCMGIDNDTLWVFGEDKDKKNVLQEYDINTLQKKTCYDLRLPGKLIEKGGLSYLFLLILEKNILLVPARAKEIIWFDLETGVEKIVEYPEEFCQALKKEEGVVFYDIQRIEKKIYFMPHLIAQILMLDMETMRFETQSLEVPAEECATAFNHYFCSADRMPIYESTNFSADIFCNVLKRADSYTGDRKQDNIGMAIYQFL